MSHRPPDDVVPDHVAELCSDIRRGFRQQTLFLMAWYAGVAAIAILLLR